ncbi:MAG TPA: SGNH/GDSL hydrolase family protein [Bryobacteraceae bacterium]|nr:SGNH/GDSL hydrolase family protein [Bryobacteraceae bacterium]
MAQLLRTLLLIALGWPALAGAQVSFVTTTGTNANYANGTITANFLPPANSSQLAYLKQHFPFTVSAPLNASGAWTMSLADTSTLIPASSQWRLQLCSPGTFGAPTCFTVITPVTCVSNVSCSGSTLDLTSSFAGAPVPGPAAAVSFGLNAALMPHWTACTAKVKINTGNCRVMAVGDSTTYGSFSTNTSDTGDLTLASYPTRLSQYLNSAILPAQRDSFMGAGAGQGAGLGNDGRVVMGTGWSTLNAPSTGGLLFTASSATTPLAFTPLDQVNQFVLWFVSNSGGIGSFAVDAGTATTFSSGGAGGLHSVTIPAGALGTHTLNMNWVSGGPVFVVGVEASNTAIGCVQIINAGIPGSGAGTVAGISWAASNSPWSPLLSVPIQAPDVVLLDLGINNWTGVNSTTVAVYTAAMQQIITSYKATSDVVLVTPAPSSIANVSLATQAQYVNAMRQLAAANNLPIVDNWNRWGSFELKNPAPFLFYNDVLHPGPNGYSDFAQSIATQLLSVAGH